LVHAVSVYARSGEYVWLKVSCMFLSVVSCECARLLPKVSD